MSISDWAGHAVDHRKFWHKHRFSGAPLVSHVVSKSFSGRNRNDVNRTVCLSPEDCRHHHFPGTFDCKSLVPHDCDSDISRKVLQGSMAAGFEATFGHTGDAPFADKIKDFTDARGVYFGRFAMADKDERMFVDGAIDGLVNVGILRDPLKEAAERCHHVGRWYGHLKAEVQMDDREVAFLTAVMAIDVTYELTPSWLGITFTGTLEGMLMRSCEKPG